MGVGLMEKASKATQGRENAARKAQGRPGAGAFSEFRPYTAERGRADETGDKHGSQGTFC